MRWIFDAAQNFWTWQYSLPATQLLSAMATPHTSELQHTVNYGHIFFY